MPVLVQALGFRFLAIVFVVLAGLEDFEVVLALPVGLLAAGLSMAVQ